MSRIRIGYGGPEGYPHGYRRRHGNMRGMSEFERLLHMFVSLQILFGSRRGSLLIPVLVIALGIGGWFIWQRYNSPDRPLATIDADWDTGDTKKRIVCIREYKKLLQKKDSIETSRYFLKEQRERIYRRIITYHVKFDFDEADARDWIRNARDEGFESPARLEIVDDKVIEFWNETVRKLEEVGARDRSSRSPPDNGSPEGLPTDANPDDDDSNSDRVTIPGLDEDVRSGLSAERFALSV